MTERLWAGWRMEYLRQSGAEDAGGECLFCGLAGATPGVENLVLERYRYGLLMLNAFPYTGGHMMVAPYRHTDSLLGESAEERAEIQACVERARLALAEEYKPHGFNIGVNLGRSAGAGVVGHAHWHVVPRWTGDTNFMPVLAATRVIPEALTETYRRLAEALGRLPETGVTVQERGHGA